MTDRTPGTAVVTGAAGGLGRAIAVALHADGWRVPPHRPGRRGGGRRRRPARRLARRAARLARWPRPVVALPRWRGAQVRLLDALPGLALRLAPLVRAAGRAGQRRQRRRIDGT
ncbi:hypothetical protein [Micromonospora inyonensis]|uniref:hypothetical protein n=1 Tax=Micromonospora inyonensis TaxID=47866 RepID=UPI000AB542F5|nr:hypothetical protein [Micromonospora inyonensis]